MTTAREGFPKDGIVHENAEGGHGTIEGSLYSGGNGVRFVEECFDAGGVGLE